MSIVYSTADVETPHRFAYWHEVVCRHCIPAASRPLTREAFDGSLAVRAMGPLEITTMRSPTHWWAREPEHLRSRPDDDFWLAGGDGEGVLTQDGHEAEVGPGTLAFYDAGRAFQCRLTPREVHLVRIPRRALLQRFAGAERWVGHAIRPGEPGATALRAVLMEAVGTAFAVPAAEPAQRLGATLIDLLAVTLEMRGGEGVARAERDLHARVSDWIGAHLDDPMLSLERMAAAHGVSSRTVTRAFARHGETAMGAVWRARLAASHAALREGRMASVTAVAFGHGFSDLSHFSRAFRQAYGCSPSTLLRTR